MQVSVKVDFFFFNRISMQVVNLCFIWGGSYWIFCACFSPSFQLPEEYGGSSARRKPFVKDVNRKAVAFHIFMENSARGDVHFVPIAKTCTSCSQPHPGEEGQMGQPHAQTTRGSQPPKITSAASVTRPNAPDLLGCAERRIPHLPLSLLALWTHALGWDHVWGNCKRWHSECFGPREGRHLVDY